MHQSRPGALADLERFFRFFQNFMPPSCVSPVELREDMPELVASVRDPEEMRDWLRGVRGELEPEDGAG